MVFKIMYCLQFENSLTERRNGKMKSKCNKHTCFLQWYIFYILDSTLNNKDIIIIDQIVYLPLLDKISVSESETRLHNIV